MTPDFSPFSYTLNNPVNFIDEFGLSGSGWNTRGREKTEAETANQEQMDNPTIKRVEITQNPGSMANIPDGGSKGWYQKAKDFVMSDGPAYKDMNSFRQGINDIGNSSFVSKINPWNPFYHGINAFNGLVTGKDIYGKEMGNGAITLAALSALPFAKIVKVAGKGITLSKASGKAMETALGMTAAKVGIKVAGKMRFPDRLNTIAKTLEEAKNVKHLNFTSQLRDYLSFSQSNKLDFILYTRHGTTFSKPLEKLIKSGDIKHIKVPGF